MKKILLLPLAVLLASCAAQSSLSERPIIISNGSKGTLYFKAVGLKSAQGLSPEQQIPFASNRLQELPPGTQAVLTSARSYSSEGGLALVLYRLQANGSPPHLIFGGIREVPMQQLETGIPIVLE